MSNNTINISPISYTNKDFRAVYEELLDLVNNLTERWDPRSTNESDPGLVLLKLKAFIADKLNYNLDKNALENFPSQATQRGNAQKIYDLLGYNMQHYKSATTTVIMRYNQGDNENKIADAYTVPAFTQITDDSNSINYVTTKDVLINVSEPQSSEVDVIEGIMQEFTINGNNVITVDNLDSNYRLYFTESMIAQNGIFISTLGNNEYWKNVNNLEATQLGQEVFKFGVLPTSNTCYLEFPQDAATLFGNGINIKYIITTGVEGNIGAGILTQLANDLEKNIKIYSKDEDGNFTSITETAEAVNLKNYTLIVQSYDAANGQNPESLKSAYRNCQKTINTFNTLVTTKDYENALFNSGVVSNAVVSDRTDDLNYSYKVVNRTPDGKRILSLNVENTANGTPVMNAFNMVLYALKPVSSVTDATSFNTTFQTSKPTMEEALEEINSFKSVQHDFLDNLYNNLNNTFLFKNFVSLYGKILTYQKVTELEAEEIQKNINRALYENYNARKVNFGVELNYDDIVKTIEKSDDRIKNVILDYPEYELYEMKSDNSYKKYPINSYINFNNLKGDNKDIWDTIKDDQEITSKELDIIAKSILAGVTPYCIFDNNFIVDYSMDGVSKVKDIIYYDENGEKIEPDENSGTLTDNDNAYYIEYGVPSNTKLSVGESEIKKVAAITTSTIIKSGDTLLKNENVFCEGPSYVTKAQLSTCLYYSFISNSSSGEQIPTYIITKYYNQSYDPTTGKYVRGSQITKLEFDNANDKTLVVKESKIVDESEYNNVDPSDYDYITKETSYTIAGPKITANNYYVMGPEDVLYVSESIDKDGNLILSGENKKYWIYRGSNAEANVICPTMEIQGIYSNSPHNKEEIKSLGNLGTSDQIEILGQNKIQINEKTTIYAVWSIDNLYNQLFKGEPTENSGEGYYELSTTLQNNDFIVYTDEYKQDLIFLGSGTEVSIRASNPQTLKNNFFWNDSSEISWAMERADISSLNSKGLNSSIEWKEIPNSNSISFYVAEKQIISLGEGTKVEFDDNDSITNIPKTFENFKYAYKGGEANSLPKISGASKNSSDWKIFSRLQLVVSPTQGQFLNKDHQQSVLLYQAAIDEKTNTVSSYTHVSTLTAPYYITANNVVFLSGGIKQNSIVMTDEGTLDNNLTLYITGKSGSLNDKFTNAIKNTNTGVDGVVITEYKDYIQISLPSAVKNEFEIELSPQFDSTLLPIAFLGNSSGIKLSMSVIDNNGNKSIENIADTTSESSLSINGDNNKYLSYFKIKSNLKEKEVLTHFTLKMQVEGVSEGDSSQIFLYSPLKINKENNMLNWRDKSDKSTVKNRIQSLSNKDGKSLFDYSHQIDEEGMIIDPLNAESFFNPNHIYNKYVIPQLNTSKDGSNIPKINISVSKQSLQSYSRRN